MAYRIGFVETGGTTAEPLVRLKGDAINAPAFNYAHGYVPVAGHQVLIWVDEDNKGRILVGKKQ